MRSPVRRLAVRRFTVRHSTGRSCLLAVCVATVSPAPVDPAPRISAEEETNQVIVIANTDDTAMMRDIVAHVDVEPAK